MSAPATNKLPSDVSERAGRLRPIRWRISWVAANHKRFLLATPTPTPQQLEAAARAEAKTLEYLGACNTAELPPLPPPVPRPEYAYDFGPISLTDEAEHGFYADCQDGRLDELKQFLDERKPSQAVRQYALEQACYAYQPGVVSLLLQQHATVLHSACFQRVGPANLAERIDKYWRQQDIFKPPEGRSGALVALVRVFIASGGWHPNQPWLQPGGITLDLPNAPFSYVECRETHGPLLDLLLSHGANPNLAAIDKSPGGPWVHLNCRDGRLLDALVLRRDVRRINRVLALGAKPEHSAPLHYLVSYREGRYPPFDESTPPPSFETRRLLAERFLALAGIGINDIRDMWINSVTVRSHMTKETSFSYACRAEDWVYAEWLLEHGADPTLLDGLALQPRRWMVGDMSLGPSVYTPESDVGRVREIIERVKG